MFNREEGRGGAGIDNMDKDSGILANVLFQDIDREVDYFMDACVKYEKAIINAHIYRRKKKNEQRLAAQAKANDDEKTAEVIAKEIEIKQQQRETAQSLKERTKANKMDVSDYVIDRWGKELANRRQYLGFLKSLQVEVVEMHEKVTQLGDKIRIELANVKALVSNKTSVPKELVYPRFDSLGGLWIELYEEVVTMIARSNTFQALCKYRLSFNPTLVDSYVDYSDEYEAEMKQEALEDQAEGKWEEKAEHKAEEKGISPKPSITEVKQEESKISSIEFVDPEEREQSKLFDDSIAFDEVNNQGATLLSVQNTPDFILLPLELQGYCPWTIVEARGLLIPGKPSLGIIRYDNLYYVCDHVLAIKAFMSDPEKYLTKIRNRALDNPEYIHLLRLQRWFPTASIARLLKLQEVSLENNNGPRKKDVGTGTPTHFIESYIDVNYHWNEWELRRRALKIVNLKNCSTTSQQTDKSHFRRDNNTQLNEVRATGTQTRRDKGTNPPVVTTYLEGLRGMKIDESSAIAPIEPKGYVGARSMSVSYDEMEVKPDSYIKLKQEASSRKLIHPKVNVVRLELDL